MASLLEVKDRVQRMLTDVVGRIEIDKDGDFTFRFESTRIYVSVRPWRDDENTIVRIFSFTNWEVPRSPELFEYIATEAAGYVFGTLSLSGNDEGTFDAEFAHSLLGDTLDPDELKHALIAVAYSADDLDDEIQKRFGGRRQADL